MTTTTLGAVLKLECTSCGYLAFTPSNYGQTTRCYCGGILMQTWGRIDCTFVPETAAKPLRTHDDT